MHANLAELALEAGRTDEAGTRARRVLDLARRIGDRQQTVYALAYLARIAAENGEPVHAGQLWGVIEAEEDRGRIGAWEDRREELADAVLAAASGPSFERGRLDGRRLSLDEAVESEMSGRRADVHARD
jgi:hypothetical protein